MVLTIFMEYTELVGKYIYAINQLERLMKEIKRRKKVIKICEESDSMLKVVYLVLREVNDKFSK